MDEIIALEEERMFSRRGQCIGKAITDVQCSAMPAFAESAEGIDGDLSLLRRYTCHVETTVAEEKFEVSAPCFSLPTFYDKGKLNPGYGRNQADRCSSQGTNKEVGIGFAKQYCDQCRGIKDHSEPHPVLVITDDLIWASRVEIRQGRTMLANFA